MSELDTFTYCSFSLSNLILFQEAAKYKLFLKAKRHKPHFFDYSKGRHPKKKKRLLSGIAQKGRWGFSHAQIFWPFFTN